MKDNWKVVFLSRVQSSPDLKGEEAKISIDLDALKSDHFVTRAKILFKLNQVDLAKEDLIKAIQLNAENMEAITLLKSI